MPKSIRIRTEPGVDRNINVKIDQDFDSLEILSLKLRQEDLYDRFCADYGIVVGRVVANGGFGVPNATISVFVPLDSVDENNPVISTITVTPSYVSADPLLTCDGPTETFTIT